MATQNKRNGCKIERAAMSLHVLYEKKNIRSYVRVLLNYEEHQDYMDDFEHDRKYKGGIGCF